MILDPTFGVRWAMAVCGWNFVGVWIGSMFWYAAVWLAMMVLPEHLLDYLLYDAGL
jgi:hypothetical protein